MMKKFLVFLVLASCLSYSVFSRKPDIWLLSDFTGFRKGESLFTEQTESVSQFNTQSDPDDYCALSMYLMNANKFNTVGIVLGADGSMREKSTSAVAEFNKWFLPAYSHDVVYWNSYKGPGGFPSPYELAGKVKNASTQGKQFDPELSYKDLDKLPETVKELVRELKSEKYNRERPLYVIVWGPLTEAAIAVSHLKAHQDTESLSRLFVVSHWTTSFINQNNPSPCIEDSEGKIIFGVANCNEDCQACFYMHSQAAMPDAGFRFVDVGAVGQNGIVRGSKSFFEEGGLQSEHAKGFLNSEMGKIFVNSNFKYNRPDGSDCATFYTILGDYGVGLKDFTDDGKLTKEQEEYACRAFFQHAGYMMEELLALCNTVKNIKESRAGEELLYPLIFKSESNPVVKHIRTADPDCHVWDDGRLWMYTSQDHDSDSLTRAKAGHGYAKMDGYHVFSTIDLFVWIDHGEILHSKDVPWGTEEGGWMWAPGAACKEGTWYLYFPHKDKKNTWRTGVATSKSPQGPFTAMPSYIEGTSGIDPMCFIDDDGTAYLYFGKALVARLSEDMLSLAEKPGKIDYGSDNFKEGPYMHKYEGKYYFSWTDWTDPQNQGYYAVGDTPYGPFRFKGAVNAAVPGAQDHHSILPFKNKWYYFYHIGNFRDGQGKDGKGYRRNVCFDNLYYTEKGDMRKIVQTR